MEKIMPNTFQYVQQLTKLLKEFSADENTTATEFVEHKVENEENLFEIRADLFENFLLLMKHEKFFDIVVHNYWNYFGLKPFNKEVLTVLFFVLIFGLNTSNYAHVLHIFKTTKYKFILNVAQYLTIEEVLVELTQAGCKVFENEYVLQVILHPVLSKSDELKRLYEETAENIAKLHPVPKKLTKPVGPNCLKKEIAPTSPPKNTPIQSYIFKSKRVPKQTFEDGNKIQESLKAASEKNRKKALKLLKRARDMAYKCSNILPKPVQPENAKPQIKPTKIPPKTEVSIKGNNASLMRQAATLVKEKETEIKKVEALTQSIFDPTALEVFEEDLRHCRDQEYLQDIERKHLQGQLTHEEAILAKQNLLKTNQIKMEEFKKERLEILAEIELWQQKEQEKIKMLVERCQNIEKAAKDAGIKMQEDKKLRARQVEFETKGLLKEAHEKKQEELRCKVQLIQELRAYQQVRQINIKEFDPTESPNFGLLCEMSIAELQERLSLLKMQLSEELEQRKKAVSEYRLKQQHVIESVKQFIDQNKVAKVKPVPRSPPKLEQTPDLIALRERLQQARQIRLNAVK